MAQLGDLINFVPVDSPASSLVDFLKGWKKASEKLVSQCTLVQVLSPERWNIFPSEFYGRPVLTLQFESTGEGSKSNRCLQPYPEPSSDLSFDICAQIDKDSAHAGKAIYIGLPKMEGSVFGWFDPAANRLKILTGTYCYYPVNQWCFKLWYDFMFDQGTSEYKCVFPANGISWKSAPANGSLFLYEASNITFVSGCYMLTCSLKEVPSFVLLFLAFRLAVASQSSEWMSKMERVNGDPDALAALEKHLKAGAPSSAVAPSSVPKNPPPAVGKGLKGSPAPPAIVSPVAKKAAPSLPSSASHTGKMTPPLVPKLPAVVPSASPAGGSMTPDRDRPTSPPIALPKHPPMVSSPKAAGAAPLVHPKLPPAAMGSPLGKMTPPLPNLPPVKLPATPPPAVVSPAAKLPGVLPPAIVSPVGKMTPERDRATPPPPIGVPSVAVAKAAGTPPPSVVSPVAKSVPIAKMPSGRDTPPAIASPKSPSPASSTNAPFDLSSLPVLPEEEVDSIRSLLINPNLCGEVQIGTSSWKVRSGTKKLQLIEREPLVGSLEISWYMSKYSNTAATVSAIGYSQSWSCSIESLRNNSEFSLKASSLKAHILGNFVWNAAQDNVVLSSDTVCCKREGNAVTFSGVLAGAEGSVTGDVPLYIVTLLRVGHKFHEDLVRSPTLLQDMCVRSYSALAKEENEKFVAMKDLGMKLAFEMKDEVTAYTEPKPKCRKDHAMPLSGNTAAWLCDECRAQFPQKASYLNTVKRYGCSKCEFDFCEYCAGEAAVKLLVAKRDKKAK